MREIIVYNYNFNPWLIFMAFQIEVRKVQHIILIVLVNIGSKLLNASSPKTTNATC